MKKHEAEKLIETIKSFVEPESKKSDADREREPRAAHANLATSTPMRAGDVPQLGAAAMREAMDRKDCSVDAVQFNELYQRIKARFIEDAQIDPILLRLIMEQPEIVLEMSKHEITIDSSTLRGRIVKLIASKFLDEPRKQNEIRNELMRTGGEPNSGSLSREVAGLVNDGFLVRPSEGVYQRAPGVKVTEKVVEVVV